MTSKEYWEMRAKTKVLASERTAKGIMDRTLQVYGEAERQILKSIQEMYDSAEKRLGISLNEYMKEMVYGQEKYNLVTELKKIAKSKGVEYTLSKDFGRRLTRLEALKLRVRIEANSIKKQTDRIQKVGYKKVIASAYSYTINDLKRLRSYPLGGATIDKQRLQQVVMSNATWDGGTYRSRTARNTKDLSSRINNVIASGLVTGQSLQKTARRIRDEFGIGGRKAMRLVQTESAYFHTQADLALYKEWGVASYEYMDILDERTCIHCKDIAGMTFSVDSAIVGENYPPIHPWCRCTTIPVV